MMIYNVAIITKHFEKDEILWITYSDEYNFYWFGRQGDMAEQFIDIKQALIAYDKLLLTSRRIMANSPMFIIKKDHLDETNYLFKKV
jgi:hypothetical protein